MYRLIFKRLIDFTVALISIILLSPIYLIIAILVRVKLGSPVIFTQERPGKDEVIFKMYKFRSMSSEVDDDGNLLPDEVRLTPFGKKLRATSLDELPELFNILKGDMSIVGPRPQLIKDIIFMDDYQRRRHTVRQGLTGLAQVKGRNNISWEDRLKYDIEYISHITLYNDFKILLNTVISVIKKDGISTDGMATSEDYGDYLLRTNQISRELYDKTIKGWYSNGK